MARVRAVREHQNLYGDKPVKADGDEYDLPDNLVSSLVSAGLVAVDDAAADVAPAKAPPVKGKKRK